MSDFDYTSKVLNKNGVKIPTLLYGTAWKEERTEELALEALRSGFIGIDTANQRKHYFEAAVGNSLTEYIESSSKDRDDVFIQTKYTFAAGQDHRKPYNEFDPIKNQVLDSFESSLIHLNLESIDSYILHGPFKNEGLSPEDFEAWEAISSLKKDGKVKLIGVSNFRPHQLRELYDKAELKPEVLQNRCFAALGWDRKNRKFCEDNNIIYEGFSLLTANRNELENDSVVDIAEKHVKTVPEIVLRFAQQIGILPLTGTTDTHHMKQDISIYDFRLDPEEISTLENITDEIPGYD
jgi:diketogulonate reductase-like aldo/keto reductase